MSDCSEGDTVKRAAGESGLSDITKSTNCFQWLLIGHRLLSYDPLTCPAVRGSHYLMSHLRQKKKMVERRAEQQVESVGLR